MESAKATLVNGGRQLVEAVEQTLALIRTLVETLPPEAKEQLFWEIADRVRPKSVPGPGEVLGKVRKFLAGRKDFTIAELKQQLDAEGVSASLREIYNAVGYLARKQKIQRVGYGRYLIPLENPFTLEV